MNSSTPTGEVPAAERSALRRSFQSGILSNTLGEAMVQSLRVGGMIVLVRTLQPADLGAYRLLLVVSLIAQLVMEAGVPEALIQRSDLNGAHLDAGWWLIAAAATGVGLLIYAYADGLARMLGAADLAHELQFLALPIWIVGLSSLPNAILRRQLRFKLLAASEALAEISFVVAALVTLFGFKSLRWSLPAGLSARLLTQATIVLVAGFYLPRGLPRRTAAREIVHFAAPVCTGRALVTFSANIDYVLVARLLGVGQLGYYTIAWDLLRFIPDRLYKMVGRLTLPIYSRLQRDPNALRADYRSLVAVLSRLELPLITSLAFMAPQLIAVLYGSRWHASAALLRLLSPGLAIFGISIAFGSIFYALGRPSLDVYLHGTRLILVVGAVFVLAHLGLGAVTAGVSLVEGTICLVGQYMACVMVGDTFPSLALVSLPGIWLSILSALACTGVTILGRIAEASNLATLIAAVMLTGGILAVMERAALCKAMAIVAQALGAPAPAPASSGS